MTMSERHEMRSIPQLLSDLTREVSALVRQEGQLVRAEVSEKVDQVKKGAGEVAGGGVLLLAAVLFVLQAAVIALAQLVGLAWSSLIVGLAAGLAGMLLLKAGMNAAKPQNLKPERTTRQVGEDMKLAKEQTR